MNESTLTRLKILVERAVRPVRASMCHKLKMREELLAHVRAVFEEEEARHGGADGRRWKLENAAAGGSRHVVISRREMRSVCDSQDRLSNNRKPSSASIQTRRRFPDTTAFLDQQ